MLSNDRNDAEEMQSIEGPSTDVCIGIKKLVDVRPEELQSNQ